MGKNNILFGIKDIKELEFFVDEDLNVSGPFDLSHNITILTNPAEETISFIILVNYFIHQTQTPFMRSKIATVFTIQDLKSRAKTVAGQEVYDIPDQLLITMLSLSITHARAMHAKSSAGTKFNKMFIPLMNPEQEMKKLLGQPLNDAAGNSNAAEPHKK